MKKGDNKQKYQCVNLVVLLVTVLDGCDPVQQGRVGEVPSREQPITEEGDLNKC